MLKITYSDSAISIEQLKLTVEAMVAQRTVVALRAGQSLVVQPMGGAFLLPANLPEVDALSQISRPGVDVGLCDRHWLEITLQGLWIASGLCSDEGIFVTELGESLEEQIVSLWQRSRTWVVSDCSQQRPKSC